MLSIRKRPTPTETVITSIKLSISGALAARTCKSGSATVIAIPRIKLKESISQSLRDFVIFAPIWLPICIMERSAPRVNSAIPKIIITEPTRNESISPLLTGTKNIQSAATISVIGKTESTDS